MGATTPKKSLPAVEELLSKDSQNALYRAKWPALFISLDAYPLHCFSEAGRVTITKRHGITDEQLEAVLLAYVHPDALPEGERRAAELARLLGSIEAVVKPALKRNKAPKGKRRGGAPCV